VVLRRAFHRASFDDDGSKPDYKNTTVKRLYTVLAPNTFLAGQCALLHIPRIVITTTGVKKIPELVPTQLPSWVIKLCSGPMSHSQPLIYGNGESPGGGGFAGDYRASGRVPSL
jgi:hypothetical protein